MAPIKGKSFFCSWSGGKDACLALYRAIQSEGRPRCLLTMLAEDGRRSRSHGLPVTLLQQQASSLRIPLVTRSASWNGYEAVFSAALAGFRQAGIEAGVFGDIDLQGHGEWVERICSAADIQPFQPLWKQRRGDLIDEFLGSGFQAIIVAVKQGVLDRGLLGRALDTNVLRELNRAGADICGENGEYHTMVINGPIFSSPVDVATGTHVLRSGYWFLETFSKEEGESQDASGNDQGIHADRTSGCDRHYFDTDRSADSDPGSGQGHGQAGGLHGQSAADVPGGPDVCRRLGFLPAGLGHP